MILWSTICCLLWNAAAALAQTSADPAPTAPRQQSPTTARETARARPAQSGDPAAAAERLRQFRELEGDLTVTDPIRAASIASMRASQLYSTPQGPLEVVVRRDPSGEPLTLMLLDRGGEVLGMATGVQGRVNLMEVISAVQSLQCAAWLQLVEGDEPIGPPIVVQPIWEPAPVRTTRALRPDQTTGFTKIIGWGDRPLDPDDPAITELRKTWIAGDPPAISGFKLYADMDVLVRTDHGEILVALSPDEAPNTVWNFRTLVRDGFYDRGGFHRVVPADREGRPFVIQGGDPTLTGNGGPGFALALEPSALAHDYGVISMARGDEPHSAGSQFFFALSRDGTARLDGQYCAFGYAVSGSRSIDSIAATPIAVIEEGRPTEIPKILKMQLVLSPARLPGVDRRDFRIKPAAMAGQAPASAR